MFATNKRVRVYSNTHNVLVALHFIYDPIHTATAVSNEIKNTTKRHITPLPGFTGDHANRLGSLGAQLLPAQM